MSTVYVEKEPTVNEADIPVTRENMLVIIAKEIQRFKDMGRRRFCNKTRINNRLLRLSLARTNIRDSRQEIKVSSFNTLKKALFTGLYNNLIEAN